MHIFYLRFRWKMKSKQKEIYTDERKKINILLEKFFSITSCIYQIFFVVSFRTLKKFNRYLLWFDLSSAWKWCIYFSNTIYEYVPSNVYWFSRNQPISSSSETLFLIQISIKYKSYRRESIENKFHCVFSPSCQKEEEKHSIDLCLALNFIS